MKIFFCILVVFSVLISFVNAQEIGAFTDYATDDNNNGLYDYLVIEFNLTVPEAGKYNIGGELFGNQVEVEDDFNLNTGENTIQLKFKGMEIYHKGVDGPYSLSRLDIVEYDSDFELYYSRDIYITSVYNHEDFDNPRIEIVNISDHGTDLDADGLFDYLTLDVEMNVTESGNFKLSWELLLGSGDFINYGKELYLNKGVQTIQLDFSGQGIYLGEANNKSYDLSVSWRDLDYDFFDFERYDTLRYNYSDFENVVFTDYVIDNDNDGLYGFLVITFNFTIPQAGEYGIGWWLEDNSELRNYIHSNSVFNKFNFNAGESTIQLKFSGEEIYSEEMIGEFRFNQLDITKEGFFGMDIGNYKSYNTPYYNYSDFEYEPWQEPPIIELLSPKKDDIKRTNNSFYEAHFKFKVFNESGGVNCSLIINGKVKETKTNISNNIENVFSVNLDIGNYDWQVKCMNSKRNEVSSELRDLIIQEKLRDLIIQEKSSNNNLSSEENFVNSSDSPLHNEDPSSANTLTKQSKVIIYLLIICLVVVLFLLLLKIFKRRSR